MPTKDAVAAACRAAGGELVQGPLDSGDAAAAALLAWAASAPPEVAAEGMQHPFTFSFVDARSVVQRRQTAAPAGGGVSIPVSPRRAGGGGALGAAGTILRSLSGGSMTWAHPQHHQTTLWGGGGGRVGYQEGEAAAGVERQHAP